MSDQKAMKKGVVRCPNLEKFCQWKTDKYGVNHKNEDGTKYLCQRPLSPEIHNKFCSSILEQDHRPDEGAFIVYETLRQELWRNKIAKIYNVAEMLPEAQAKAAKSLIGDVLSDVVSKVYETMYKYSKFGQLDTYVEEKPYKVEFI